VNSAHGLALGQLLRWRIRVAKALDNHHRAGWPGIRHELRHGPVNAGLFAVTADR